MTPRRASRHTNPRHAARRRKTTTTTTTTLHHTPNLTCMMSSTLGRLDRLFSEKITPGMSGGLLRFKGTWRKNEQDAAVPAPAARDSGGERAAQRRYERTKGLRGFGGGAGRSIGGTRETSRKKRDRKKRKKGGGMCLILIPNQEDANIGEG